MSALKQKYEKFADFMQHNTKGVEIGIYSISGAMFAIAYYKIRPITKFVKSNDIPKHFITKKVVQKGTIKTIEPNQSAGAILRIDHKPPLNLFFLSHKTLPVKIFGIDINGNGYSWLNSVTLNKNVEFIPISKSEKEFAECQIKLLQNSTQNSKGSIDLAEALLSLGFAKTSPHLNVASTDAQLKSYLRNLKAAQLKAAKQQLFWPINIFVSYISRLIYAKLFPPKYRLPELVR